MSKVPNNGKGRNAHIAAAYLRERWGVRYKRRIRVEVSGINRHGEAFHESTFTRDVSEWGCTFLWPNQLAVNDMISIRTVGEPATGREPARQSLFQVLRVTRDEGNWLVAAWKLEDGQPWEAGVEPHKTDKDRSGSQRPNVTTRPRKHREL